MRKHHQSALIQRAAARREKKVQLVRNSIIVSILCVHTVRWCSSRWPMALKDNQIKVLMVIKWPNKKKEIDTICVTHARHVYKIIVYISMRRYVNVKHAHNLLNWYWERGCRYVYSYSIFVSVCLSSYDFLLFFFSCAIRLGKKPIDFGYFFRIYIQLVLAEQCVIMWHRSIEPICFFIDNTCVAHRPNRMKWNKNTENTCALLVHVEWNQKK